jgi:hypothetical protein
LRLSGENFKKTRAKMSEKQIKFVSFIHSQKIHCQLQRELEREKGRERRFIIKSEGAYLKTCRSSEQTVVIEREKGVVVDVTRTT